MAIPTLKAVGFCAHYSDKGDWAFDFALNLSKRFNYQLNVFHFLEDPYDPNSKPMKKSREEIESIAVAKEKELRMYYDELAGEYLDVGFRVCYDKSWTELHRCLLISEFQILVLARPEYGAYFAKKPIEEFAEGFISPIVLVGPENPEQLSLNKPAYFLKNKFGIDAESVKKVEFATA